MNKETVDHPSHYNRGGYECQDVIEALELSYSKGAALKYLWRAGEKIDYPDEPGRDEIEDLRKAAWYCNREADRLEGKLTKEQEKQLLNEDEEILAERTQRRGYTLSEMAKNAGNCLIVLKSPFMVMGDSLKNMLIDSQAIITSPEREILCTVWVIEDCEPPDVIGKPGES